MKPGWLALAGTSLGLLAIGGLGFSLQRAHIQDLEDDLDRARLQLAQEQTDRKRLTRDLTQQETRARHLRADAQRLERRWLHQQSCLFQVADEDTAGDQTVSFGFIDGLDDRGRSFLFDPARWLVGSKGAKAARADGALEKSEPLANDYYIRNLDRAKVTKSIGEDVEVVLSTADRRNIPTPKCVTRAGFRRVVLNPRPWEDVASSPFWLVEREGAVVRILEQYVP